MKLPLQFEPPRGCISVILQNRQLTNSVTITAKSNKNTGKSFAEESKGLGTSKIHPPQNRPFLKYVYRAKHFFEHALHFKTPPVQILKLKTKQQGSIN